MVHLVNISAQLSGATVRVCAACVLRVDPIVFFKHGLDASFTYMQALFTQPY
jgi:hypothetical protein